VLVVDDDASIRLLVRINCELDGYTVLEAATLAEARQLLASEEVDVALVDVHISGEDGRDLVREQRASGRTLGIALLTGSIDMSSEDRAGADAVIVKPFTIEGLLDEIRSLAAAVQSSA
jgi:DNA-binding response OmpR family regulator